MPDGTYELGTFRQARTTWRPCQLALPARSGCPERQESIESLDRGASSDKSRPRRPPERPRDAIFDDFGSIWEPIFVFFEVATRKRLDSQREWPNLCFCWQAWYETEISHLAKKPKIDKHRRKIAPTGLRDPAVRQKLDFSDLGGESASKLIASARFRAPRGTPKKLLFFTGTLFGTLRALPGHSRGASKTLRIVPGSSLCASGFPGTLPSAILGRF